MASRWPDGGGRGRRVTACRDGENPASGEVTGADRNWSRTCRSATEIRSADACLPSPAVISGMCLHRHGCPFQLAGSGPDGAEVGVATATSSWPRWHEHRCSARQSFSSPATPGGGYSGSGIPSSRQQVQVVQGESMHSRPIGLMQSVNAEPETVVTACVSKSTRDRVCLTTEYIAFYRTIVAIVQQGHGFPPVRRLQLRQPLLSARLSHQLEPEHPAGS